MPARAYDVAVLSDFRIPEPTAGAAVPAGCLHASANGSGGRCASGATPDGTGSDPDADPWVSYFEPGFAFFEQPPAPRTGEPDPAPRTGEPDPAPRDGERDSDPGTRWTGCCSCGDPDRDPFADVVAEVSAQAAAGRRTVLVHLPAPRHPGGTPFSAAVAGLLRSGRADLARDGEALHAAVLLVHRAHRYEAGLSIPAAVTADRTVVVIDRPADLAAVQGRLGPDWALAPACPRMRALVHHLAPAVPLDGEDRWVRGREGDAVDRRAVVGRVGDRGVPERSALDPVPGRRFLFVGGAGPGTGRLTRLMAIGRRLPAEVRAVVATQSYAVAIARGEGFLAEYIPATEALGATPGRGNAILRARLAHLIAVHAPELVAVDGLPHDGVTAAVRDHPQLTWVWVRTPMWHRDAPAHWIAAGAEFDAVLEPGDLARAADAGPTAADRARTREIAPVTLLDEGELLAEAGAREAMGLVPGRPAALVRLRRPFAHAVAGQLAARGFQVVLAEPSPVPDPVPRAAPAPGLPGVVTVAVYPVSRYLRAFDLLVSAAGYNACHEAVAFAVPAVLVPDARDPFDDQAGRARFAASSGVALTIDDPTAPGWEQVLDAASRPEVRAALRRRCRELAFTDGAAQAAAWLCATSRRVPTGE